MTELPLCSSAQVVAALQRVGFNAARRSKGSHQAFVRVDPDGRKRTTVVILGRSQIPRGTLRGILELAGLAVEEFRQYLR